jgi:hypothetical protein
MVIFAVDSTGKAFTGEDSINRVFYHCAVHTAAVRPKNRPIAAAPAEAP